MQSKEIRGEDVNVSQKITKVLSGGKVTSITQQENGVNVNVTEYSYNENDGRLEEERFYEYLADGSPNEVYSQTYNYNDDGQLSCETINSTTNPRAMYNQYTYDENGKLVSYQYENDRITISPKIDCLGRNRGKSFSTINGKIYSEDITYLKHGDHATSMPLTISYGNNTENGFVVKDKIKYKYDEMGNICEAYENGQFVTEYKYDALGRLVRENNKKLGKTFVFSYDNKGNILTRTEYAFTLKDDDFVKEATGEVFEYVYSGEKLVSYNGEAFAYDDIGNPTTYRGNTLTWRFGRRLTSFGDNTFDYNAEGKRIKKNDISYIYDSQGRLFAQSNGIEFFYDENSSPIAFAYNGEVYYYKKDLLGNVIEILDTTGTTVVKYTYDAWGNHKVLNPNETENISTSFIGNINPIRYRSYYFDIETGLYFLQTRYYDPQTGRFINIDDISYLEPEIINGLNLYAYCLSNPIMYFDNSGHMPEWLGWIISGVAIIGGIILCATGVGGIAGGVLIGAGAGSLINGYVAKANGGDFTAGYIGGAISGALCGVGAGFGGLAFMTAANVTNLACIGYLALGATVSFAGGFVGNLAGTVYTNWHNSGFERVTIDWQETFVLSAMTGALNVFAGIGSGMSTIAGNMGRAAIDINSKWALRILAGTIAGGTEALFDLASYLIGKLVSLF